MVSYSYIPPSYKTKNKMSSSTSSNTSLLLQQTTICEYKEPHIPYRDTGVVGKSIFGQAPSWKYKPLPPSPFEKAEESPSKPLLSKFKEHDCDNISRVIHLDQDESELEIDAKQGKIAKAVKNFSKKLTSIVSKT